MKSGVFFLPRDHEAWSAYLQGFPEIDIYFLPAYHQAYQDNGDGTACAFWATMGEHRLFHPFFLRKIPFANTVFDSAEYYDIESVYGYSGPLSTHQNPSFLKQAWAAYEEWCRDSHVVAEFVRFHPLLKTHLGMSGFFDIQLDRQTVYLSLNDSHQDLWNSYPSVQRNMVRKAQKNGLSVSIGNFDNHFSDFLSLYESTMSRAKAKPYYFFHRPYYDALFKGLQEHLKLFYVEKNGTVIASGLFFAYNNILHYHLAGSDFDFRSDAPNNLLLHAVSSWGIENGFRHFHLGGGRSAAPDDDLFRFKASISKQRCDFYIGRRIHCLEWYNGLCDAWMAMSSVSIRPPYFLLYRMPKSPLDGI